MGLVHGDIKPANLMIKEDADEFRLSLVDFGLASSLEEGLAQKPAGTPNYMAPEVLLGEPAKPASDLYSAAVCIYEMITKKLPLRQDAENTLLYTILQNDPTPVSKHRRIPKMLDTVLGKALSLDVADRYLTAYEFYEALEQAWESGYRLSTKNSILLIACPMIFLICLGLWPLVRNHLQEHQDLQQAQDLLQQKQYAECREILFAMEGHWQEVRVLLWQSLWAEFLSLLNKDQDMQVFFDAPIWKKSELSLLKSNLKFYYVSHQIGQYCLNAEYDKAIECCDRFVGTKGQMQILQNQKKRLEFRKQQKP